MKSSQVKFVDKCCGGVFFFLMKITSESHLITIVFSG